MIKSPKPGGAVGVTETSGSPHHSTSSGSLSLFSDTSSTNGSVSGDRGATSMFAHSIEVCHRYTAKALNGVSYAVGFVAGRVLCFGAVYLLPQRNKLLFGAAVAAIAKFGHHLSI